MKCLYINNSSSDNFIGKDFFVFAVITHEIVLRTLKIKKCLATDYTIINFLTNKKAARIMSDAALLIKHNAYTGQTLCSHLPFFLFSLQDCFQFLESPK